MRRSQLVFGLIIFAALAILAVSALLSGDEDAENGGNPADDPSSDVVEVVGYIGSEKEAFLQNPEVQRILAERYGLRVDFTKVGSIEQVTINTAGQDFLWPSNEVALELYRERHPGAVKSETIFNSPIVLYSWADVTAALIDQGYVREDNGIYYASIEPMVNDLIFAEDRPEWRDLGMAALYGPVNIVSSDPVASNSGNMFYGLLLNLRSDSQIATLDSAEAVLPDLKAYYDSLGFLQQGSGDLFESFVRQGMGAYPLIVNYESLLIEFSLQNVAYQDQIQQQVRIIYPEPTVWSSHPMIALTPEGEALMAALQDPDLQQIAWEQHGFRSGLAGIQNNPADLEIGTGIPATITAVMPLPRPAVMDALIDHLRGR